MIRRLNHVGISVVSLERSLDFYRDLLGMEVVVQTEFSGEKYSAILGLPGAKGRVALVKATDIQLELFEFHRPSPGHSDPKRPVSDHGITHFCIEVHDIDGVYERLKSAGTSFHCAPLNFPGVAKATYARDPDGNVIELMEKADP